VRRVGTSAITTTIAAVHSNPTPIRQVLRGIVSVGCTGTRVRVKLIAAWNSRTINRLPPVPL
jgi:hypothetical protein